jgi:hypothetical protein
MIERQDGDSSPAFVCLPLDSNPVPTKMLFPSVYPRIEKRGHALGFRIDPGKVRALPQIAIDTGQCQIFRIVATSMLACPNMLNLKFGKRRLFLTQSTVLATIARPFTHHASNRTIHLPYGSGSQLPSNSRAEDGQELVRPGIPFIFRPFVIGERSLTGAVGQPLEPSLQGFISMVTNDLFGLIRSQEIENRIDSAPKGP